MTEGHSEEIYNKATEPLQSSKPIVYLNVSDLKLAIYEVASSESKIINSKCLDTHPNWSPDYQKIVLSADCTSDKSSNGAKFMEFAEIYTMNKNGKGRIRLTDSGKNFAPRWSPDSKKILFQSNRNRNEQVYIMNSDGSNQKNISNNSLSETLPDWHPEGDKIVFTSGKKFVHRNIYTMDINGANKKKLTDFDDKAGLLGGPRWSPNGKKILFTLNQQVYTMNSNGSNMRDITPKGYSVYTAAWSPTDNMVIISKSDDICGISIEAIDINNLYSYQITHELSSAPDW